MAQDTPATDPDIAHMTQLAQPSDRARSILDAVDFELAALKHPVEVLTIEAASTRAGVSASTVTSGVNGVEDFRHRVFAETLLRLNSQPPSSVWETVQQSILGKHEFEDALARLIDAASRELAKDPAFPFVISVYAAMTPSLLSHLDVAICRYVDELRPLIATLAAACGRDLRESLSSPMAQTAVWITLSTAALEPLLRAEDCWSAPERTRPLSDAFLTTLDRAGDTDAAWPETSTTILPTAVHLSASLTKAVHAGVDLLLQGALTPNADLTVAEICRRAGVGVSAFYRHFGSTDEFNRIAIGEAGRRARATYIDELNQAITDAGERPQVDWDGLLDGLIAIYLTQSFFSLDQRVDSPLWPWINTEPATRSLREFVESTSRERATIYRLIAQNTGRHFVEPFDADRASWLFTSLGSAGNIERNRHAGQPERQSATSELLGIMLRAAIEPVSLPHAPGN